jgi:streptogramin lyase
MRKATMIFTVLMALIVPARHTRADYQLTWQIGNVVSGSGAGQFASPLGIAVDSSGNVWVADTNNNRIQEFNSSGGWIRTIGTSGSGDGQFKRPSGVAGDSSGNIWVADFGNNRIQEFNSSGGWIGTVTKLRYQTVNSPRGICVNSAGYSFVAEAANNAVLTNSPTFLGWSGDPQPNVPTGVAADSSGNIWVANDGNHTVAKYNSSGHWISTFGGFGTGNGQFEHPMGIAVDASGDVWVADWGNSRIQEFDSNGVYLTTIGVVAEPYGVAVDSSGSIYVVSNGNANGGYISKFSVAPEPSTLALLGVGAIGLLVYGWRRRKTA